jgi:hypothetical protein
MATTPGGLPYPIGTDFVVDGDNAIRALAEELDGEIYSRWAMASGMQPLVGGFVAWTGVKTGSDVSTLNGDKTIITLAKSGVYRVDAHLGLGANAGIGTSSALQVNGAVWGESQMYGNTGAAGVFVSRPLAYITAVGGTTQLRMQATAPLGLYDWSWMRLTFIRRART